MSCVGQMVIIPVLQTKGPGFESCLVNIFKKIEDNVFTNSTYVTSTLRSLS